MGAEVSVSTIGLYVLCSDVVLCVSCAVLGIGGLGRAL